MNGNGGLCEVCDGGMRASESLRCMLCRRLFHFSTAVDAKTNCGSISRARQSGGGA